MSAADLGMPAVIGGGKIIKHLSAVNVSGTNTGNKNYEKVADISGLSLIMRVSFFSWSESAKCRVTIDGVQFEVSGSKGNTPLIGLSNANVNAGILPPLIAKERIIVEVANIQSDQVEATLVGTLISMEDVE